MRSRRIESRTPPDRERLEHENYILQHSIPVQARVMMSSGAQFVGNRTAYFGPQGAETRTIRWIMNGIALHSNNVRAQSHGLCKKSCSDQFLISLFILSLSASLANCFPIVDDRIRSPQAIYSRNECVIESFRSDSLCRAALSEAFGLHARVVDLATSIFVGQHISIISLHSQSSECGSSSTLRWPPPHAIDGEHLPYGRRKSNE